MLSLRRSIMVDVHCKSEKYKKYITSGCEEDFKSVLLQIGEKNKDWISQYAIVDEDEDFVAIVDFFIPIIKTVIEIDELKHQVHNIQIKSDIRRDTILNKNGYNVIRIKAPLTNDEKMYWIIYLKELIKLS